MHPAEDWAETVAHDLHIRDAVQTAAAYGVGVAKPPVVALRERAEALTSVPLPDPGDVETLIDDCLPLTYALDAINRSMGRDDPYPFVLTPPVMAKLGLVHGLVCAAAAARP